MKHHSLIHTLCLVVGLVLASDVSLAQGRSSNNSDRQILRRDATDSLHEIGAAQLALTKSQNAAVQKFAQELISDHTAALEEMAAMAAEMGISLPDTAPNSDALKRLQKLDGERFDLAFVDLAIRRHAQSLMFNQAAAMRARSSAVREFARNLIPVLAEHLRMALEAREALRRAD